MSTAIADQVFAAKQSATKTIGIEALGDAHGGTVVTREGTTRFYYFRDGSWLGSRGRGRQWRMWTATQSNSNASLPRPTAGSVFD